MKGKKNLPVSELQSGILQSRDVVDLLAQKWRIRILHALSERVLRRHELQNAILGVAPKVLTQTLRGMERDGLVERTMLSVAPAHVEYALTRLGQSVVEPLRTLCQWAESHMEERDAARRRFDDPSRGPDVQ